MPLAAAANANPPMQSSRITWPREELGFALAYVLGGAAWIIVSDRALDWMTGAPLDGFSLQTFKGLNFVFTTGFLFYLVLQRNFNRRRRAEAESESVSHRFALAGRAATDAIWDWDLTTNGIWWSEGFQTLFGYAKNEIEPTIVSWTSRLHPSEKETVVAGIHRDIDAGKETWAAEYRLRRKDGSYAVVHDRGFIIKDESGKPIRMVGGITDITHQRAAADALDRSRRQLRALLAKAQTLREEERTRISREVHDELGGLLTALKMDLNWMKKRLSELDTPIARSVLERTVKADALADTTIATVQKIATDLRPGALDHLGLSTALRQEAEAFEKRTGVRCRADVPEELTGVSGDAATVVFRIFQETLTNVARHAQATEVQAQLSKTDEQIELQVDDNGKGITVDALTNPKSLGLLGMKERAAALGGAIDITPLQPHGTCVSLTLPCGRPAASLADMI